MLGSALLVASRSERLRHVVSHSALTRRVVARFVAGETLPDALRCVRELDADGLAVTLDHLGEDVTSAAGARASRDAYLRAVEALAPLGLGRRVELSVKLSAFGQALPGGDDLALANVRPVVEAATEAGTTVTLDMESHPTIDSTLATVRTLRADFPATGAVLQSALRRTEQDLATLTDPGSRIRLVKGAYREPKSVAYQDKAEVDASYARCLGLLMRGEGYPMIGSHDPRMIAIGRRLAAESGRAPDSYEFQMLYGIRPDEQRRLAAEGATVRAYLPYGVDWYGYFMRRLAERPANLTFFLRSLATRG